MNTSDQTDIVCPYCGWRMAPIGLNFERGAADEGCGQCERPFTITRMVETLYSTFKLAAGFRAPTNARKDMNGDR